MLAIMIWRNLNINALWHHMPEQSPSRCLSGKHLHHDHQKGEDSLYSSADQWKSVLWVLICNKRHQYDILKIKSGDHFVYCTTGQNERGIYSSTCSHCVLEFSAQAPNSSRFICFLADLLSLLIIYAII